MSKKEKFLAFLVIVLMFNTCYCLICIGFFDKDLVDIAKHLIFAIINYLVARNLARTIYYGKQG